MSTHDATSTNPDASHVPEPAGGVRGVDQVDAMDPSPGTTTGADGATAAREQLRVGLGERPDGAGRQDGDDLEQAAALGDTDDAGTAGLAGG